MHTTAQLKELAKKQLHGKTGLLWMFYVLFLLVLCCGESFPLIGSLSTFIFIPPLTLGIAMVYLDVSEGENPRFHRLADGFRVFIPSLILFYSMLALLVAWTILLIAPGVKKAFSYSMAFYILAEHPAMSPFDVLKESESIMTGHKKELFSLYLSFSGWLLLTIVTCGFAGLYVFPYLNACLINFYHDIKKPL